jgi:hypothetical protein
MPIDEQDMVSSAALRGWLNSKQNSIKVAKSRDAVKGSLGRIIINESPLKGLKSCESKGHGEPFF